MKKVFFTLLSLVLLFLGAMTQTWAVGLPLYPMHGPNGAKVLGQEMDQILTNPQLSYAQKLNQSIPGTHTTIGMYYTGIQKTHPEIGLTSPYELPEYLESLQAEQFKDTSEYTPNPLPMTRVWCDGVGICGIQYARVSRTIGPNDLVFVDKNTNHVILADCGNALAIPLKTIAVVVAHAHPRPVPQTVVVAPPAPVPQVPVQTEAELPCLIPVQMVHRASPITLELYRSLQDLQMHAPPVERHRINQRFGLNEQALVLSPQACAHVVGYVLHLCFDADPAGRGWTIDPYEMRRQYERHHVQSMTVVSYLPVQANPARLNTSWRTVTGDCRQVAPAWAGCEVTVQGIILNPVNPAVYEPLPGAPLAVAQGMPGPVPYQPMMVGQPQPPPRVIVQRPSPWVPIVGTLAAAAAAVLIDRSFHRPPHLCAVGPSLYGPVPLPGQYVLGRDPQGRWVCR